MAESFCTMPEPLTPADCDLRGFPFMPLDVARLIDSDLFALSTGDEFKAAVALWCKSWIQLPAASLPDDDRILAHLSGAGARWKKIRGMALKGWIKCLDGRLYHPVISEKAAQAWKSRIAQRERAAKRWDKQKSEPGTAVECSVAVPDGCHGISHGNATDTDTDTDISSLRSDIPPVTPPTPEKPDPRGTRLLAGWEPTDEMRLFAMSLNLNPTPIGEQFRDYWLGAAGAKGRKADWLATWRSWCRREAEKTRGAITPLRNIPQTRQDRVHDAWAGVPTIPGV
ncbi:MAG: DUF1376 domain-containing protein [Acetobacter sp.]|uniref:DUF1376 domain-containing protein n=1 Tax=Acetobacter sp. TaxID=440 RepID=UPI003F938B20